MYGYNIRYSVGKLGAKISKIFKAYTDRVLADGGTVVNSNLTAEHLRNLPATDSIEFAWVGGAGSKKRTSGIYSYFTKLYSFFTSNDAVQTTETLQPFVSGNIAPNEIECLKNVASSSVILSNAITFTANEAWTCSSTFKIASRKGLTSMQPKSRTGTPISIVNIL